MQVIKSNQTVFELVKMYPELKEVLYDMGFKLINNPAMSSTMGKIMTIEKGCKMRDISLEVIIEKLKEKGYQYMEVST